MQPTEAREDLLICYWRYSKENGWELVKQPIDVPIPIEYIDDTFLEVIKWKN